MFLLQLPIMVLWIAFKVALSELNGDYFKPIYFFSPTDVIYTVQGMQ